VSRPSAEQVVVAGSAGEVVGGGLPGVVAQQDLVFQQDALQLFAVQRAPGEARSVASLQLQAVMDGVVDHPGDVAGQFDAEVVGCLEDSVAVEIQQQLACAVGDAVVGVQGVAHRHGALEG
jgi:hypothetical protein